MACCAIGGYLFRFVAPDAELHIDRDMRLRKRKGHVVHIAVAVLAGDFSERDVAPVREIGMVGHPVHLDPRDQLILFDEADEFLLLFAVRHRFFMAVLAKMDIGDGCFLMGLCSGVTVKTAKSCFFYMLLVIIGNRLGEPSRIRATAHKE